MKRNKFEINTVPRKKIRMVTDREADRKDGQPSGNEQMPEYALRHHHALSSLEGQTYGIVDV
jgi:hypothetical protein